ncbi:MAG: NfeD family protein [Saccharofermentanales bacterium]|jgi:membrane-bound ClpP family serine protease
MNIFSVLIPAAGSIVRTPEFFSYLDRLQPLEIVLLVAGVILLVVEMFTPGFGLAGGTGVVLLVIGIILTAGSPLEAIALVLILIVLVSIMILLLLRSARKGRLARNMILHLKSSKDKGYRSSEDKSALVGQTGTASSDLRPSGVVDLDGERLDVVTQGSFIRRGTKVRIIEVTGNRVVVATADDSEPDVAEPEQN